MWFKSSSSYFSVGSQHPRIKLNAMTTNRLLSMSDATRKVCVIELCIVMHSDAVGATGDPDNLLKYKASGDPTRD